jgi:hypothetical protein
VTAPSRGTDPEPPADDERPYGEPPAGPPEEGTPGPAPEAAGTPDLPAGGDTPDAAPGATGDAPDATGGTAPAGVSEEAAAELAAQRELRERIDRRRAERGGAVESGAGLSGTAAELLAAVRAVESGEKPGSAFYRAPAAPAAPAPRAAPAAPAPAAPVTAPVRSVAGPAAVEEVRKVLAAGGAPGDLAGRAAAALGERAAGELAENPWRLLAVPGTFPEQADGFARALLGGDCGPGDGRRTTALAVWRLERAAERGHTALRAAEVREALAGWAVPDPDGALALAVDEGAVLALPAGGREQEPEHDREPEEGADGEAEQEERPVLLALDRWAMAEESLAEALARVAGAGPDPRWDGAKAPGVPAELVRAVAGGGLVLHTGGAAARAEPVALAALAERLGLRAAVAVPGEPDRDPEGPAVVALSGLLAGTEGPGRDAEGALALDLLVVPDAQRLDVETAALLAESLPEGGRLVLGGDPEELESAGPGRVFGDLLAARVCPRVASRTPDPGPIGELVSGIGAGELNEVAAPGREVVIVPVRDAGEAVHRTVQLVADSVPRAIGVPPAQTQVITVGHGGAAGTRALNTALKLRLNPGPGRFGGFDPGDRVAHSPAPGRTVPGTVVSADGEGLLLECPDGPVRVPRDEVGTALRHGWALTAHQAAGRRWPAAVVVLPGDAAAGLSRPWVYTAFGRGVRHLSVVHGVAGALRHAVAEVPAPERTTRLRALLEGLLRPAE